MIPDSDVIKVCLCLEPLLDVGVFKIIFNIFQVVTEILDDLKIGAYVVKLNHRKLLDAMMDICGTVYALLLMHKFKLSY